MGRHGASQRDNKLVQDLLIPHHLVLVPANGQEVTVNALYAGRVKFSVETDKKCDKYKCRHCSAFFAGDMRRCARHYLPHGLPKGCFGCVAGI